MSRAATPADVLSGAARWCVHEGDALALLASLPDECVDAVISDPPYGIEWRGEAWDADIPPQHTVTDALRVSNGAVLWFAAASRVLDFGAYVPRPDRVIAWAPTFTLSGARVHGLLFHWDPIVAWRPDARRGSSVFADVVRHRRAVAADAWWDHGCTKPVPLMRDLASSFTDPGDVILDPFAGSGTTGVAALAEGRRVILCERVPEYAEIARRRCEAAAQGTDWRAPAAQLSLLSALMESA